VLKLCSDERTQQHAKAPTDGHLLCAHQPHPAAGEAIVALAAGQEAFVLQAGRQGGQAGRQGQAARAGRQAVR
jgi:hypothetical protein